MFHPEDYKSDHTPKVALNISFYIYVGAWGSVVVKALRY